MGLIAALLLTACAGATIIGAGCQTYAKARAELPFDAVADAPVVLAAWLDSLDFAMKNACAS